MGVTDKCNDSYPVSYTHLDVYKRQLQGRLRAIRINPCMKLHTTLMAFINHKLHRVPIAVSYTHLIGTFQRGIFTYDLNEHKVMHIPSGLMDVSINCIRAYNNNEILIACLLYTSDTAVPFPV